LNPHHCVPCRTNSLQSIGPMATNPVTYPMSPQSSSAQQTPNNLVNHSTLNNGGYPELASFFSQCSRSLHLRRFSALAARLLLYRQHELIVLERRLKTLECKDAQDNDRDKRLFSENYALLKKQSRATGIPDTQYEVYETLKSEMKEYGTYRSLMSRTT